MTLPLQARLPACMGGWCQMRDQCARHVTPSRSGEVSERLCRRGAEHPIAVYTKPAKVEA
jgi:hypothetical protein